MDYILLVAGNSSILTCAIYTGDVLSPTLLLTCMSGTIKLNSVGKDRLLESFDETGLEVTDGFLDHTTWHCWGAGDFANGMGGEQGQCIATDSDGDKIIQSFISEKHAPDQKSWVQTITCSGGTGKVIGVSCSEKDVIRSNEFPPAPEGTYVTYVTIEGTYKLK